MGASQASKASFTDQVESLEYVAKAPATSAVLSILGTRTFDNPERKQVFFYSDFQKSAFNPKALGLLDTLNEYYFVPLASSTAKNVFVDYVFVDDEFIRLNQATPLRIRLFNSGSETAEGCNVKVYIDDVQVSALSLDLEPQQYQEAQVNFTLSDFKQKLCRVEVEDYPVSFDNTFYFTLKASDKINILEITPQPNSAVQRLYTNEPLFVFNSVSMAGLNYKAIEQADLVVVNGLEVLDEALAENLKKFTEAGGNVVVVPSENVNAGSYTSFLNKLGVRNVQVAPGLQSEKYELAAPDLSNAFFQNVFQEFDRKMLMPKATQVLTWRRSERDILRYKRGGSFLSSFNSGAGNVYVFSAPFAANSSEFSSHALFVPVMYKLAMRSYRSDHAPAYTLGSGTIYLPVQATDTRKGVFKLVQDSVAIIPEQQIRNGNLVFTTPADMTSAGFYNVVQGNENVATLAFNYSKKESLLEQYSAEDLRQFIAPGQKNVHVYDTAKGVSVKEQFEKQNFGVPLWKYCLILCLIFLMVEILLIRFL
ncbi:MAG: hypothetical protein LPJ89_05815 [Hymenobacteraceae bacterium]|nr:hypothetical protein [Hymenobacteraceae bacterium]